MKSQILFVLMFGLLCAPAIGVKAQVQDPNDYERRARLSQAANAALGLEQSAVVSLDINTDENQAFFAQIPFEDVEFTMLLVPHSVRSDIYEVLQQIEDGSLVKVEPGPVRTMRGMLLEVPGSVVAASLLDDGLYARVKFTDGDLYWVEPIGERVAGAQENDYIIFHNDDILETGGACGIDQLNLNRQKPNESGGPLAGGPCGNELYITQLGCDADVEFFNDYGSVAAVEARINTIINFVNVQYESDLQITHEITTIIVRSAEPDPYSSTDPVALLTQFRNEWLVNQGGVQRDLAHLFTGKNINGGVIGIAWTLGAICETANHYCLSELDFNGVFGCATDLVAHEMGHLWNADHCNCASHTMNPFITCANQFSPSQTIPQVTAYRDSRPCLDCDNPANPPVEANLLNIVEKKGTILTGDLSSILDPDNDYVTIDPGFNNAQTKFISNSLMFAKSPVVNISQLNLTIETGASVTGVKTKIYLRNWDTNHWDRLASYNQPTSDTQRIFTDIPNPNSYVRDSNRKIRVRIQSVGKVSNLPNGYIYRIDHVQVDVVVP